MAIIKSIAVDFDGTLSTGDTYPFIKALNTKAISVLKEFQSKGGQIALTTAREGKQLAFAIEALESVGFRPNTINDNLPYRIKEFGGNVRKVMGDIFIDDRCIDYTGDWDKYREILITNNDYFKTVRPTFKIPNRGKKKEDYT